MLTFLDSGGIIRVWRFRGPARAVCRLSTWVAPRTTNRETASLPRDDYDLSEMWPPDDRRRPARAVARPVGMPVRGGRGAAREVTQMPARIPSPFKRLCPTRGEPRRLLTRGAR